MKYYRYRKTKEIIGSSEDIEEFEGYTTEEGEIVSSGDPIWYVWAFNGGVKVVFHESFAFGVKGQFKHKKNAIKFAEEIKSKISNQEIIIEE